jgi:CBS domain containing-hemolysin-like protein
VAEPAVDDALHSLLGLGGVVPDAVLAPAAFAVALGIVVFSHTVFGEMVPKSLAIADAERALLWLAAPMRAFLVVFRPAIAALDALAGAGLRLLRVERREELLSASTAEELSRLLTESAEHGVIAQPQHELLSGAIEFGQRTVDAVMTPRERIVAVSTATSVTEAEAVLVAAGISRLPVYARGRDDMVGFVHAKDLLSVPDEDHHRPIPRRLLRRMLMVGQHRSLDAVLVAMRRSRLHLALVVDENGRTAGLVTLEDVLEQLVGAISDETDVDAPPADGAERG